jgi:hypothetical protein
MHSFLEPSDPKFAHSIPRRPEKKFQQFQGFKPPVVYRLQLCHPLPSRPPCPAAQRNFSRRAGTSVILPDCLSVAPLPSLPTQRDRRRDLKPRLLLRRGFLLGLSPRNLRLRGARGLQQHWYRRRRRRPRLPSPMGLRDRRHSGARLSFSHQGGAARTAAAALAIARVRGRRVG